MQTLTLDVANHMIAAALATGADLMLKPLCVVVLDAGGHLVAMQRQDGASMLRPEIAVGKAFGALAMGAGSRALATAAVERPHFFQGLSGVSAGRIVPVPGGVLVRAAGGTILGAVGISGDTSDNDETCAVAGIEAAGFSAEP